MLRDKDGDKPTQSSWNFFYNLITLIPAILQSSPIMQSMRQIRQGVPEL